jgi:urease accessory protein
LSTSSEAALTLQSWLSPAFPTGAFTYSHGLEWAVETGAVRDSEGLAVWLRDILTIGSGRNDAILIAAIMRADGDSETVAGIAELALALAPSRERFLESAQQGASFGATISETWPVEGALRAPDARHLEALAYPVAFGMAASAHGIDAEQAIAAYLNAFCGNLVSAGIRLSIIGQNDGQRIIRSLLPDVAALAASAITTGLDDLGSATTGADLASMKHETQYSRLFRS